MKKILVMMLALVMLVSLASCGGGASSASSSAAAKASTSAATPASESKAAGSSSSAGDMLPIKAVFLLPGLINDYGWNAGAYAASNYLNDKVEGVESDYLESVTSANIEATIRDYADQGYNLIVAWSFEFMDAVFKVAGDYPEVYFVLQGGQPDMPNVAAISNPYHESSFLCGVLAARMSKTGTIGYIGGMENPQMVNALEGYKQGAEYADANTKVVHSFAGSWSDTELGYQTALAQFEQGVDVMMGRGDGLALGVQQACIEKEKYLFGDVTDQNDLAPDLLLTSTVLNIGRAIELIIGEIRGGTFADTPVFSYGMADGVVDISDFHGLVPDDIAKEINDLKAKIISGDLVVEERTEITT